MSEEFAFAPSQTLRALALRYPDVSEGASCVNRAFKVRKKNFLFVGEKNGEVKVMLKLGPSLDAARTRASTEDKLSVGGIGWVTWWLPGTGDFDQATLTRWVDESYRLMAPKSIVKKLGEGPPGE